MKVYIITGIICSGKTAVINYLTEKKYCVISADNEYDKILLEKGDCVKELVYYFGQEILTSGEVNKKTLAKIVFNDNDKLDKINKITHKYIIERIKNKIASTHAKFVFLEIPRINFQFDIKVDGTILIDADKDIVIDRIMRRDNKLREEAEKIYEIQANIPHENPFFVINNNGNRGELKKQIKEMLLTIGSKKK